ncbi:MAG: PTS sugar transporter subunit IIA [Fusobacteriaceae bacterium]
MKLVLKNNISIVNKVNNWKDGVKQAGKILVSKNKIEERYIDATIKNIEKFGSYIILTDGVAMPHARPEDGSLETGVSLLVIKEGVIFFEDQEKINLIFMLASKDNTSHMNILRKLSNLIDDEEIIKKISNSSSENEILSFL